MTEFSRLISPEQMLLRDMGTHNDPCAGSLAALEEAFDRAKNTDPNPGHTVTVSAECPVSGCQLRTYCTVETGGCLFLQSTVALYSRVTGSCRNTANLT